MKISSDWFLTASLAVLIAALFLIARVQSSYLDVTPSSQPILVDIIVEGHVARPGVYQSEIGIPFSEVIRKAKPKAYAILDLKERVVGPSTIYVAKMSELLINVTGAVESTHELKVPVGTRISDLKKYVLLKGDADLAFFRKRRLLKNGETLIVPSKSVDKKKL